MASALRFSSIDPSIDSSSIWEEDSSSSATPNLTVIPAEPIAPPATAALLPRSTSHSEVVTLPIESDSATQARSRSRFGWLKQVSSIACGVLVASTALTYGHRVYLDQQSDQAQQRLDQLERDERQLTIVIEALKYQAAQLAEAKGSNLVRQGSDHVIFLEPSFSRPDRPSSRPKAMTPPRFPISY